MNLSRLTLSTVLRSAWTPLARTHFSSNSLIYSNVELPTTQQKVKNASCGIVVNIDDIKPEQAVKTFKALRVYLPREQKFWVQLRIFNPDEKALKIVEFFKNKLENIPLVLNLPYKTKEFIEQTRINRVFLEHNPYDLDTLREIFGHSITIGIAAKDFTDLKSLAGKVDYFSIKAFPTKDVQASHVRCWGEKGVLNAINATTKPIVVIGGINAHNIHMFNEVLRQNDSYVVRYPDANAQGDLCEPLEYLLNLNHAYLETRKN